MTSVWGELRRRNVVRVAIAYAIVAWLLIEVSATTFPILNLPEWAVTLVTVLLLIGFPIAMIFAWAFEITPEGIKLERDIDRSQSITHITGRTIDYIIIATLVLALSFFVFDKFVLDPSRDAELVQATTQAVVMEQSAAAKVSTEPDKSIAVLPFVNMSNDPDQEYFSDGISEELLNVLAKYPGLRVAARTSSFQFKGQNPDIEDISQKLHVNHVLEGSVRKSGNTLRITALLIDTRTGFHLWSETYDRELIDVFAIQDEISTAIGDALGIQLELENNNGNGSSPTVLVAANTGAFEAYMQGRQLINLRGRSNLEKAVTYLERALALDENYAPSHAQLAIATLLLSNSPGSYGDILLEEAVSRATPHIERAFELEPHLPEAFAAATVLNLITADYDAVILNANRTLELNPSYADALNWLYISYHSVGLYVDATETLERLLEVDPLSINGRGNLAHHLAVRGQMEVAREMVDSLAGQNRAHSYVGRARLSYYAGHPADALEWSLKANVLDPGDNFIGIFMSRSLGQLGMLPEALRLHDDVHYWAFLNSMAWPELVTVARQRMEKDPSDPHSRLYLANALHLSGEIERAQVFYEDLLASSPGLPIIDVTSETLAPSARAAFGRLSLGNEAGALDLVELTTKYQRKRNRADFRHAEYYRTSAILEALQGDRLAALQSIEQAIKIGPRDPSIFSEPAFENFHESPEFQSLKSKLATILASEREKALQMICFNNPVADAWQPLPETCEGVEAAP